MLKKAQFRYGATYSHVIVLCLCFLSNMAFAPSAIEYLKSHNWVHYLWVLPDIKLYFFGFPVMTDTLVAFHVFTSLLLLLLMNYQILSTFFFNVAGSRHRHIGRIIYYVIVPPWVIFSLAASIVVFKTPLNQFLFSSLPFTFVISFYLAVRAIRKKDFLLHMNIMIQAFIILQTAGFFRCVQICFFLLHKPVVIDHHMVDGTVIITGAIIISLMMIPLLSGGGKINFMFYFVPTFLFFILIVALIFLPWKFYGVADISRVMDQPWFLLKHMIRAF